MLGLAAAHGLGLVQTARMLAMAYVVRADAMVACFDAKYHYWVWRPYQAIPLAATNANPATVAGPNWRPRTTPTSPSTCPATPATAPPWSRARMRSSAPTRSPYRSTAASPVQRVGATGSRACSDVDLARVLVGLQFFSSD